MRYSHLDKLFTVEGLIMAAITLLLTLIICQPRKANPIPLTMTTTPDSAAAVIHFTDTRSPGEIRAALEREHMAPFDPILKDGRLEFHATTKCNTLPCTLRLTFNAAHSTTNDYSLHIQMSWAHLPPASHAHYHASFASWLSFWSRDLKLQTTPASESPNAHYQTLVELALVAEASLTDIPAIQKTILTALKRGAVFRTSHKEGGTNIGFANGAYHRKDFGEWTSHDTFADDASFLGFLRKFYDWETSRSVAPAKVPDVVAWRLILRLLDNR